jgi:iron complex transport system substrate-binding protein
VRALRSLAAALMSVSALSAIAAPPARRIVSTAPSITETLFALDLGDRVVGVSRYCRYPPRALTLPRVGSFVEPDPEAIARLSPDLVVLHPLATGTEERLKALHLRTVTVDFGGLDTIYAGIDRIAEAAGVPDRGTKLRARLEQALDRTRAQAAKKAHPKVLLIVGRRPGALADIVAVGRSSYLDRILEIAGGVNVLSDAGLPEYPHIALESILRLRPDVIIDTGDLGDTEVERERSARANQALWRGSTLLKDAGITRIYTSTTDALVVPGPRVAEVAEWMRKLLQDER